MIGWNDERVDLLKKLWGEGLSASQIAGRLGDVTRNAVIGKVHRLGLAGRATTSRMKSHRPRARAMAQAQAKQRMSKPGSNRFGQTGNPLVRGLFSPDAEPYVPAAEELIIPLAERKSIQTLMDTSCRWPIGDPQLAEFHFCGKTKVNGLPYCEFHARRAFQPPQAKRRHIDIIEPSVPMVEHQASKAKA